MSLQPVQITTAPTLTMTIYNVETAGKIIITLDGDVVALLPHVTELIARAGQQLLDGDQ